MKKIELEICTIKERVPSDGAQCWVEPVNSYLQLLTYNEEYQCWDDAEGDDYFCDVNENDIYIELPKTLE